MIPLGDPFRISLQILLGIHPPVILSGSKIPSEISLEILPRIPSGISVLFSYGIFFPGFPSGSPQVISSGILPSEWNFYRDSEIFPKDFFVNLFEVSPSSPCFVNAFNDTFMNSFGA